jgi:hypothetical protein
MSTRSCLAYAAASALVVAFTAAPASAAAVPMTLSSAGGPSGGGNTLIGTVAPTTSGTPVFAAGVTPTVQFQYSGTGSSACGNMAKAVTQIAANGTVSTAGVLTVDPAHVKRISGSKVAFKVPSQGYPNNSVNATGLVLAGSQTTARWNACVYDSDSTTSSSLLATAGYTLVLRPTITSIVPSSSPAGGGQQITVNGTGFAGMGSASLTAAIGNTSLTNIKVATNGNSFTATTGPRAAGAGLALTVTTPGGTVSSLNPDNDNATNDSPIPFTYTNGITITPTSAAVGTTVTVDVMGAGFSQLSFDPAGGATSANAHVFLVSGAYDSSTNRGVAECRDVAVISDVELVCTLDLAADRLNPATSVAVPSTPVPEAAYTLTVVESGAVGVGPTANPTIVSSGSTFTVGPY